MRDRPVLAALGWAGATVLAGVAGASSLWAQTPPGTGPGGGGGPLQPDTVLTPPSGPRIVRLPAPGSPVVSLRLSVPVRETAAEAGAGRILQILGAERATSLARPMGATVEAARTPWGIAYTVTGAAADVDFLAFLLREAVSDPEGRSIDFRQAVDDLEAEAERRLETPGARVAARLRQTLAPDAPPPGGTLGSLARLTPAGLRSVWARSHRPERMTLVVAGDVPLEVLLASFQEFGAPGGREEPPPPEGSVSEPGQPRLQVLRHWYGEGRIVGGARDPHAEVSALLIADRLHAGGGDFEAEVQLWQLPDAQVLAVVGAAYASNRQEMRRRVQSVLAETAEGLTPAAVEGAVGRIEADVRMRARTPSGRTGLVGTHLEATGEVTAAGDFLAALESVSAESTRAFLSRLAETTPETVEVRP